MVDCNTRESMHGDFLGVTSDLLDHWLNPKKYKGKPFYLKKKKRDELAKIVDQVKLPGIFQNKLQPLVNYKKMKAWELRVLMFYVLEYILGDFLPKEYYENYLAIARNLRSLHSKSASEKECLEAGLNLKEILPKVQQLYGDSIMTLNFHGFEHIGLERKKFGVSYARSAFPFESFLGKIMRSVKGTNRIESHMIFMSDLVQFLDMIYGSTTIHLSDDAKEMIAQINPQRFNASQEKWLPIPNRA